MVSKFKQMMDTSEEQKSAEPLPMTNGIPTKEGLLTVVRDMASQARAQILENSQKFMGKRQEFYGVDEEKYCEVVMQ